MLSSLTHWIEKAFNCRIYRNSIPHGTDMYIDIDKNFGLQNIKTVFDVGANVGQSALAYLKHFADATIYSFEPVAITYQLLNNATKKHTRIRPFCCGMGREPSQVSINVNPINTVASILHTRIEDHSEHIDLNSISCFCEEHHIETIDFLKIDTEGYELEVLGGAISLLQHQRIRLILVECEPILKSDYFVSFTRIVDFLGKFEYELFGIYEQQLDWDGRRCLIYFNAMFICKNSVVSTKGHL